MSKVEILQDETGRLSIYIDDTRVTPRSSKPLGQPKIMAKWDLPLAETKPCPTCEGGTRKLHVTPCRGNCKDGRVLA